MNEGLPIGESTRVRRAGDAMAASIDEATSVLLPAGSNVFFGLDDIGGRVWELIAEPVAVRDLCAALRREYDVDPVRCQTDVVQLLRELIDARLAETVDT